MAQFWFFLFMRKMGDWGATIMEVRRLPIQRIVVVILLVMLVIYILPVWLFKYTPTQDGPIHVHNAYVLKEYHNHENYMLREVYKLNPTLFPNWTSHVLMAGLMFIFPPLICEKILFSLCIGLLPLSLFYFLNSVQKGRALFCLVGFIFGYNYLLHMGFYNFALSVSLFFFALGYWWRCEDKLNAKTLVVMYVWLIVVYFTHFQSYALLTACLTFCGIYLYIYEALEPPRVRITAPLKPILLFLGTMLPAYVILLSYYLAKREGGGYYRSFEGLKQYFLSIGSIVSFRDDHILIGNLLLAVFAVVFLLTVIMRIRGIYMRRNASLPKNRSYGNAAIVARTDVFLLVAIILTFLYFKFPWSLRSGGMWISDRIHIYVLLTLLPFFSVKFHRYVNYAFGGILVVLALWHLSYNLQTYYLLNKDVTAALPPAEMIEPNTVLASRPSSWGGTPDSAKWDFKYILPFEHIEGYLALENGVAYLQNYEPNTDHFPLRYRNRDVPPDYVLVWRTEYDNVEDLAEDYVLVHTNNYNRLYQRKKAAPAVGLSEDAATITFDMQPHDGKTALKHIPIYKDTGYTDGQFGWLSKPVYDRFKTGGGGFELKYWDTEGTTDFSTEERNTSTQGEPNFLLSQDNLWGEDDGVFRVALPNGTYEVMCYFHAGVVAPVEINLIANGEKRFEKLHLTSADESAGRRYIVTITDERLTQVIYTKKKRWAWSGFTIKRLPAEE